MVISHLIEKQITQEFGNSVFVAQFTIVIKNSAIDSITPHDVKEYYGRDEGDFEDRNWKKIDGMLQMNMLYDLSLVLDSHHLEIPDNVFDELTREYQDVKLPMEIMYERMVESEA